MQRGLWTGDLRRGELEDQEMGSDPGLYRGTRVCTAETLSPCKGGWPALPSLTGRDHSAGNMVASSGWGGWPLAGRQQGHSPGAQPLAPGLSTVPEGRGAPAVETQLLLSLSCLPAISGRPLE